MRNWVLPILLVLASPSLLAAPGHVAAVQADLDAHGYDSPTTAAARLQAAPDAGNPKAPLEQRRAHATDDLTGGSAALANIGIATARMGHVDEGVASLRQSLALARQSGKLRIEAGINRELVKVLESAGRYQEALAALRALEDVNARIGKQERDGAVLELQAKYDDERKNREIERLSTQARLKEAEAAARRWQQGLWATWATVAVLATLLLVLRLVRARRTNRQLVENVASPTERSSLDELTGVFNRRHFAALMQPYADAGSAQVGLVMLDLDHFTQANDRLGHAAGDAVLVEVARRLQSFARNHDHVVRWGGEEFVLLLHAISPHDLPLVARRLLDTVTRWPVHVGRDRVDVSISAGCVVHPLQPGGPWEPALRLADAAMYHAKRHGRNRAVCVTMVNAPLERDLAYGDVAAAILAGTIGVSEVAGPSASAGNTDA